MNDYNAQLRTTFPHILTCIAIGSKPFLDSPSSYVFFTTGKIQGPPVAAACYIPKLSSRDPC